MIGGEGFDFCNSFNDEAMDFNRQVHQLILGTLRASLEYLSVQFEIDVGPLRERLDSSEDSGEREWLDEELQTYAMHLENQQTFARNMALVALASRLTHTLKKLASRGDTIRPRTPASQLSESLRGRRVSEFEKLWHEFTVRFGIDFSTRENKVRTEFVRAMGAVRNRIVHAGGEADTWIEYEQASRPESSGPSEMSEIELRILSKDIAETDFVDHGFSRRYPEYVEGSRERFGLGHIRVSQERLEMFTNKSSQLVNWLANALSALCREAQQRRL